MLPGQMLLVPSLTDPTVTWIDANTSFANETTYNFGNFTAASSGLMIAVFLALGTNTRAVSSISIGGGAATIVVSNPSGNTRKFAIGARSVSVGAQNVTCTLSGDNGSSVGTGAAVGVWLMTNYGVVAPFSTNFASSVADNDTSMSMNYAVNGVGVFGACHNNNNGTTWSNATERFDANVGASRFSFADYKATNPETGTVVQAIWSGSVNCCGVGGTWR